MGSEWPRVEGSGVLLLRRVEEEKEEKKVKLRQISRRIGARKAGALSGVPAVAAKGR